MQEHLKLYEDKMEKSLDVLLDEYASIRAGRANPHVLDKIRVDYYGSPTPLQQVGNVTVPEPRMIQIAPWEKSLIKAIEKYNEVHPDLVLMDITMPEMDGIQALKKIKEADASACVIMCSAMGQQAMVIESIQAVDYGMDEMLPFTDVPFEAVKKVVG